MSVAIPPLTVPARGAVWKWSVCGLLLLATTINYLDRQTLSQLVVPILDEFDLSPRDYGRIESAFALAFAFGALLIGWLVDRVNVRWVYPAAVLVWSAAGFATGYVHGFVGLLACRFVLGVAESGNWPCALRTTQRILPPEERTLGNSILQSGASVGAVLAPLVVVTLYVHTGTWRYPFLAVGVLGLAWTTVWLFVVRSPDLALPPRGAAVAERAAGERPFGWLEVRRFVALVVLVVSINLSWHFFRAWLPLFLQKQHGYSLEATGYFTSAYYVATDAGALSAGFLTLRLARRGMGVHRSRVVVYLGCALLTALSLVAANLPAGPLLQGLLLVVGFGSLGVFPAYYSFSQELTVRHQGKLTGVLGCACWLAMAGLHEVVGRQVEATGSYSQGVALAGLGPLVGFVALITLWGPTSAAVPTPSPAAIHVGRTGSPAVVSEAIAARPAADH